MTGTGADILAGLPGADRVLNGLEDYRHNRHTIDSCLVRIARPRLAVAGFIAPSAVHDPSAELDLYQLLHRVGTQAHSRYNALLRELVSFEHALDQRLKLRAASKANVSGPPLS